MSSTAGWSEPSSGAIYVSPRVCLNGNRKVSIQIRFDTNLPQGNSPKLCSVNAKRFIPVLKLPATEKETKTTTVSTTSFEIKESAKTHSNIWEICLFSFLS